MAYQQEEGFKASKKCQMKAPLTRKNHIYLAWDPILGHLCAVMGRWGVYFSSQCDNDFLPPRDTLLMIDLEVLERKMMLKAGMLAPARGVPQVCLVMASLANPTCISHLAFTLYPPDQWLSVPFQVPQTKHFQKDLRPFRNVVKTR